MFAPGSQVSLYNDDAALNGKVAPLKINKKQEVELIIPCNGASLIVN